MTFCSRGSSRSVSGKQFWHSPVFPRQYAQPGTWGWPYLALDWTGTFQSHLWIFHCQGFPFMILTIKWLNVCPYGSATSDTHCNVKQFPLTSAPGIGFSSFTDLRILPEQSSVNGGFSRELPDRLNSEIFQGIRLWGELQNILSHLGGCQAAGFNRYPVF